VLPFVQAERHQLARNAACDGGESRVVGIEGNNRIRPNGRERRLPHSGDGVDLAIAIELVPKEVVQEDQAGADKTHNLRKGGLVRFDDRDIATGISTDRRLRCECADDAPDQVGAGTIVHDTQSTGSEDIGNDARGRGFAIGAGHDDRALGKPGRQFREHSGIDAFRYQSWGRGSATTPKLADTKSRELCGGKACRQPEIGHGNRSSHRQSLLRRPQSGR
jgi:hypothetical protein